MNTPEYQKALDLALKVRAEKHAEVAASIVLSALREAQQISENTEPREQPRAETGLPPCPFCGSDVEQSDEDAWCFVCNILVRKSIWNKRTVPQPSGQEKWENVGHYVANPSGKMFACASYTDAAKAAEAHNNAILSQPSEANSGWRKCPNCGCKFVEATLSERAQEAK